MMKKIYLSEFGYDFKKDSEDFDKLLSESVQELKQALMKIDEVKALQAMDDFLSNNDSVDIMGIVNTLNKEAESKQLNFCLMLD